ncbi:hypothetical protein TREAZ_2583 [Leadbettera azotonutricia ZAS-9]|uniref:Uncharacterized protein n=1 Tax=Leadbettera azotonutricia (strain ATCC BAA-888 / DSM 13862 / ZAS-9) TaxID=545695 RepID=F5YEI6_LEAAZ|nr:hypothetical protein TREAZ_2583 [Leadbettera azotonutricia ZAS-9]
MISLDTLAIKSFFLSFRHGAIRTEKPPFPLQNCPYTFKWNRSIIGFQDKKGGFSWL